MHGSAQVAECRAFSGCRQPSPWLWGPKAIIRAAVTRQRCRMLLARGGRVATYVGGTETLGPAFSAAGTFYINTPFCRAICYQVKDNSAADARDAGLCVEIVLCMMTRRGMTHGSNKMLGCTTPLHGAAKRASATHSFSASFSSVDLGPACRWCTHFGCAEG